MRSYLGSCTAELSHGRTISNHIHFDQPVLADGRLHDGGQLIDQCCHIVRGQLHTEPCKAYLCMPAKHTKAVGDNSLE